MRRIVSFIILFSVWICSWSYPAESNKKIATFGYGSDIDSTAVYGILHHNAPEDFRETGVPAVAVVGKGGKFILGVGGYVKAVTGFDFGHPIASPDEFITSQIPMEPVDGNGMRYNLSAKQTHIFINFVALPGTGNEIGAFVSANLLNNYLPTIQYAYLKYKGIKAGYDNALFSDPACGAPAVDYEGPCSNTASPVGGMSYTWEPEPHGRWMVAAGIELPVTSFTTIENKTKYVYQRMPDIPLAAKFAWNDGSSWVRASSVFRMLTYRDIPTSMNHNRFGYGFQLSGAFNFLDCLTLYYQGVWGKGIGSLIQDTVDEGLDMTPVDNGNALAPVMVWGGFMTLEYNITNKWDFSVTYSHLRTYANKYSGGTTEWNDLYKYAQYTSSNLFFKATSFFEVGLEYIWGRRTNYDGLKCADNRLQLAFQLSF